MGTALHRLLGGGRLSRGRFWLACLLAWGLFWLGFGLLDGLGPMDLTRIPAALLIVALGVLCVRRCHDLDHSGLWLLVLLIPVLGVVLACVQLGLRRGTRGPNRFGDDPVRPRDAVDYLTVTD